MHGKLVKKRKADEMMGNTPLTVRLPLATAMTFPLLLFLTDPMLLIVPDAPVELRSMLTIWKGPQDPLLGVGLPIV